MLQVHPTQPVAVARNPNVPSTEEKSGNLTLLSSSFASWKAFSLAALAISLPLCRSYSQKMTAEAVCAGKTWCELFCKNAVCTDAKFVSSMAMTALVMHAQNLECEMRCMS